MSIHTAIPMNQTGHNDHLQRLRTILSLIDLTTLEGTDNPARIESLCRKALAIRETAGFGPAAVCVYPVFVKQAALILQGSGIKVASVAGAFPSGQSPLHIRKAEVEYAVEEGADEIDMVISRGSFLTGNLQFLGLEVETLKKACGKAHLKVILETGELPDLAAIKLASELSIKAGADFIKTSTGKIQPAATLEAMSVMLDVIREYYHSSTVKIGIKPAGGISTPSQALEYYALVEEKLGNDWLNQSLFRIGASRLTDGILSELGISLNL